MSVQAAPVGNVGSQFFNLLPVDPILLIFDFLKIGNDEDILATERVCKAWQANLTLRSERQEVSARLAYRIRLQNVHAQIHGYPLSLIQLFDHTPIQQLPVLELGNERNPYITSITPEKMRSSVMRFKDHHGRPGIAFRLKITQSTFQQEERSRIYSDMSNAIELRDLSLVFAAIKDIGRLFQKWKLPQEYVLMIFQRYPKRHIGTWVHSWGNGQRFIENLWKNRHTNGDAAHFDCEDCPFFGAELNVRLIRNLLHNRDPDVSISEHNGDISLPIQVDRFFFRRAVIIAAIAVVILLTRQAIR